MAARRGFLGGVLFAALLITVPVGSLGAHFSAVLGHDLHPGRDHSIYELNIIAFLHGRQLVGPYSQFGWHHLGPAFFAILGAPYALSGFRSLSLVLSMLAWSAAMMVVFLVVSFKRGGASAAVAGTAALAAFLEYENRLPLYNYWSPFFDYLALPACAALMARLAEPGGKRALPWAVALSTVLVQTHIGAAPPLVACWAAALAVRAAARRRGIVGDTLFDRRAVLASAGVAVLLWTPPVVAELRGAGNWSKIAEFFASSRRHTWSGAVSRSVAEVVAPFRRVLFGENAYAFVRSSPPHSTAWLVVTVVYVAALVASVIASMRLRRPFLAALASGALGAVVLSPLAIRRAVGAVEPHYVAWISGATVVGLTAIAGAAGAAVAARWPPDSVAFRRVRAAAPWCAFSAVSLWLATARGFVPEPHLLTPGLSRLADAIDARLRTAHLRAVVVHGTRATMPWHFNLGLELYRRGHSVKFAVPGAEFYVGPYWVRPVVAPATVHLVGRKGSAPGELVGCEDPPQGSLIVGSLCPWFDVRTP